jgi:hypothetical protein
MKRRKIVGALLASAAAPAAERAPAVAGAPAQFARTSAEIAANVTPLDYAALSGPSRYGAVGDDKSDDTAAWVSMGKVNGCHRVADGSYRITHKVQTSAFVTIIGATRQNTILHSSGFADYLFEVGSRDHGPNPNVGALQRLRFIGSRGNTGLLHMNQLSHMWRLDDLLFQSSPCPALIIDNCWDSNYTNIDILSCGAPAGSDPSLAAMVIIRNGSNNIYLRGIRMEHAPVGVLYVGESCSPIYIVTGKIDQGYIPQNAAAVTVAKNAVLVMGDFNITGVSAQFVFDVAGSLLLNNVSVYGGSGMPAINDARAWVHVDATSVPGAAGASFGPQVANINLGSSQFYRSNPSVNTECTAVIHSKIFPIRLVERVSLEANGQVSGGKILVQTDLQRRANNLFDNCFLVHNPTGTQAAAEPGSRRLILTSFTNGQLLLQGTWPCTTDSEWSVEFCGGHFTPNLSANGIQLEQGMTLFTVIASGVRIRSAPRFNTTDAKIAAGATLFKVSAGDSIGGTDVRGYFLVDDLSGEPFLICHGLDSLGQIAVMYDCTRTLKLDGNYSITAGYWPNILQAGGGYEWTHAGVRKYVPAAVASAYGFSFNSLPLWGIGQ